MYLKWESEHPQNKTTQTMLYKTQKQKITKYQKCVSGHSITYTML